MSEYISTIIYICVFCIILELILPENKLKKYIGVLVSLVIILTLVNPILNIFESKNVIATISNAIENIQSKVELKEYDFSGIQERIIFSSSKENIEKRIFTECKTNFKNKFEITGVKISLENDYAIKEIDIYVKTLPGVSSAGEIIDFVSYSYNINTELINVIKENK